MAGIGIIVRRGLVRGHRVRQCEPERGADLARSSDEKLIARFRSCPDEEAFEELARRYSASAYRAALAILGSREDAEDAVQDCFLRLIRARSSYRPGMRFSPWFFTILRNTCSDELRRRHRGPQSRGDVPEPAEETAPRAGLEIREEFRGARRAFHRLRRSEREVLALRIHGGLKFSEIATACGISVEAAKKRAYRGLDRLRRELDGLLSGARRGAVRD